jgi:amidophosphoribosyltransferase
MQQPLCSVTHGGNKWAVFFGVASKEDCIFDLFYGTDYHSHLGTRRAGMAVYDAEKGFDRAIHNIESSYFRPKFERDIHSMRGNCGIGVISDYESQPLVIRSHLGVFAIATVGKINNTGRILAHLSAGGHQHFMEMSGGGTNPTELVASIISQADSYAEGLRAAQELIRGSMTILLLTPDGIYASRDRLGRTPVVIGKKRKLSLRLLREFFVSESGVRA